MADDQKFGRAVAVKEKTVSNQTRAAELLGITGRTLQTWMIDLDIPRPRGGSRRLGERVLGELASHTSFS